MSTRSSYSTSRVRTRKSAKIRPAGTSVSRWCAGRAFASADGMAFANMTHQEAASMGCAFILWLPVAARSSRLSVLLALEVIGFFH
jgi:hypothetical protein